MKARHGRLTYRSIGAAILLVVVMAGVGKAVASPPEYVASERAAAESVADEKAPMDVAYDEEAIPSPYLVDLGDAVADAAPFWRDSKVYLRPRSYYFDRQRENANDSVAAAYGGWAGFRSGALFERVRANATLFTTQRAYGPDDKEGTLLLGEGQEGFWVLGEANLAIDLSDSFSAKLYRQSFNLPYLNRNDSRMVPNTFEAYTVTGGTGDGWGFVASHVTQMKRRDSDDFVSLTEAAGFDDVDEPLSVAAASVDLGDSFSIGATYQYSWEFMQTYYGEANAVFDLGSDFGLRLGVQYTGQESIGDEVGGEFDTSVYGGKIAASFRNAILTVAFTSTDDARIRNPYGGYPGYLSLMIQSFNRAKEDGWLVGLSYDFTAIGLPGLSGFVNYAEGDTPDGGEFASPDQEEFDITVDYRFQSRWLRGLWLRARAARLDQDDDVAGASDVDDYRIILNYEFSLL